ncbi:LysR family transcriptional regulator [Pseudomonas sp. Irchel 3F5]|uniref:LysR family transcriptional regulator n=1 Tax=Pseudomonas sp. Irchel 3F5 TaxID=2009002 RepID=UPI000BA34521|nr:LysR family transcriptional regulator [Pseudomonas sp. Irchel 3F5]
MSTLFDLGLFVRVADEGSLSAAARSLDITPAAASLALKRLETRLQVRLFARSTRQQRLTNEGRRYLDSVRLALGALAEGEQALREQALEMGGLLQLAAPSDFGRSVLLAWLDAFKREFPRVQLQLLLNDQASDLYREPVDVALRFGVPADSDMVALPILLDHQRVACASPEYLARHGTPATPQELAGHQCVIYQRNGRPYDLWRFARGSEVSEVRVHGEYRCDDGEVARRWALAGHGVVYKAWLDVAADVAAGRLQRLFGDWQGEHAPVYLMCPHRAQVTERVKALQAFLQTRCLQWAAKGL